MSSPTPGPWEVYDSEVPGATYGIDAASGVAVVWYGDNKHDGICNEADAHLIAAAPDLLEALSLFVTDVQPWTDTERKNIARAAIAKATGAPKAGEKR